MPHVLTLVFARSYSLLLVLAFGLLALPGAMARGGLRPAPLPALEMASQPPARLTLVGYLPGGLALTAGGQPLQVYFGGAESVLPDSSASLDGARYTALWPGVSLRLDREQQHLRARFTLSPGADPARLRLKPSRAAEIQPDGSLRVANSSGAEAAPVIAAPLAWQYSGGQRVMVESALILSGSGADQSVLLWLGEYDPSAELEIEMWLQTTVPGGS